MDDMCSHGNELHRSSSSSLFRTFIGQRVEMSLNTTQEKHFVSTVSLFLCALNLKFFFSDQRAEKKTPEVRSPSAQLISLCFRLFFRINQLQIDFGRAYLSSSSETLLRLRVCVLFRAIQFHFSFISNFTRRDVISKRTSSSRSD